MLHIELHENKKIQQQCVFTGEKNVNQKTSHLLCGLVHKYTI